MQRARPVRRIQICVSFALLRHDKLSAEAYSFDALATYCQLSHGPSSLTTSLSILQELFGPKFQAMPQSCVEWVAEFVTKSMADTTNVSRYVGHSLATLLGVNWDQNPFWEKLDSMQV